ncbi:MAG: hypothetical protein ABR907_12405 [Terracidiphilus sp.]|jgi:hypothetical protein
MTDCAPAWNEAIAQAAIKLRVKKLRCRESEKIVIVAFLIDFGLKCTLIAASHSAGLVVGSH